MPLSHFFHFQYDTNTRYECIRLYLVPIQCGDPLVKLSWPFRGVIGKWDPVLIQHFKADSALSTGLIDPQFDVGVLCSCLSYSLQHLHALIRSSVTFCRYLDDFYELELQTQSGVKGWIIPETKGGGPSPRESHTCVAFGGKSGSCPKLFIFGGMCGNRLSDLWQLDVGKLWV